MLKDYVFLVGRVLYALPLIIMGSNHFTQFSNMAAYTGLVLILGAVSVLVGYRGRIGAALVTVFLLGTAFLVHRFWGISDTVAMQGEMIHFFKDLIMAGAALMITQSGTGPFSVDNLKKAPV
jgi:putative oxidoreductase